MATFINGWTFNRGTGSVGSWTYSDAIPKVTELGGLGKENPLIRVTSFDSAAEEYIAGLADGKEFSVTCNFLPGDTIQRAMVADCDAGAAGSFQFIVADGTTTKTMVFDVVALSWELSPSFDDKNSIAFSYKISGSIAVTYSP